VIDIAALRRVARLKGLSNLGFAEKDYFQEIILLGVSREAPGLVFKGGTALCKFFGLNRFSEDVDFSGRAGKRELDRISGYLEDFGYGATYSEARAARGRLLTFAIKGFLYRGTPQSMARVRMDVNPESGLVLEPGFRMLHSLYPDIPAFGLNVMAPEEMAAEKARALLVRARSRDAFDLWFLVGRGVKIDVGLVDRKLKLYDVGRTAAAVDAALRKCRGNWKKELLPMAPGAPDFGVVEKAVRKALLPGGGG
jgi:predicted nucleotidyltransferase component of viral defense system